MHFGVSLLLLLVSCGSSKNDKTFLGLPEEDVQVVWSSAKAETLRRSIRSPDPLQVPLENEKSGRRDGDMVGGEEKRESVFQRYWREFNCSDHVKFTSTPGNTGGVMEEELLPPNYNKLELPHELNGEQPQDVLLGLNIRSIAEIDEAKGEFVLAMGVKMYWFDEVIALHALRRAKCGGAGFEAAFSGEKKVLDTEFLDNIWKPDIFIEDLVSVERPKLVVPPARLQFSQNGFITYNTRARVKIACQFNFEFYPADTQKCDVVFRSYSHNGKELALKWYAIGAYLFDTNNDNFDVSIGSLERYRLVPGGRLDNSNETFDCLQLTVSARRRLSYHLIQTYVPSMLYVGITWLCFMIPRRLIEGRMAIVMTTLLSLTAMFASVRESTPAVSYTKAIDIWMVACIVFVFAVLLHFSLLLWTETEITKNETKTEEQQKRENQAKETGVSILRQRLKAPHRKRHHHRNATLEKCAMAAVEFIEAHSFIIILCVFTLFNALYWTYLLQMSGYFEWNVSARHNEVMESNAGTGPRKFQYPEPEQVKA